MRVRDLHFVYQSAVSEFHYVFSKFEQLTDTVLFYGHSICSHIITTVRGRRIHQFADFLCLGTYLKCAYLCRVYDE